MSHFSSKEAGRIGGKSERKRKFLAGLARRDITPAESLPMGGYIERAGPATGTHDPLFAKAVVFRSGAETAVLLCVDLLCVSRAWTQKLRAVVSRKTGAPPDNILIAATHTHSGPAVFSPMAGGAGRLAAYAAFLLDRCAETIEEAFTSAEPSRLYVGRTAADGIGGNRRAPGESTICEVSVVRLENMRGEAKGRLVSFACHPTVMGPSNLEYSADLFGAAAAGVERENDGSLCLMFNGAAGDISSRFTRREQTWAEVKRLGGELAERIIGADAFMQPITTDGIYGKSAMTVFPFRDEPDPEAAQKEYDEALRNVEAAENDPAAQRLARSLVEGAAARAALAGIGGWQPVFGAPSAEVETQALRIGGVTVCGLPGEFFSTREQDLREAALPQFGFTIGYANGYWGYLVPPIEAAKGGYETMMSPLDPEREPEIIDSSMSLIRDVSRTSASENYA